MNREELIEKMLDGYHGAGIKAAETFAPWAEDYKKRMAAALDVAVGELLGEPSDDERLSAWLITDECWNIAWKFASKSLFSGRRSRYLKPKSDPAVEAVQKVVHGRWQSFGGFNVKGELVPTSQPVVVITPEIIAEIIAAVRAADKSLA